MFFFNDTATTEIYTLSLHDALPISRKSLLGIPLFGTDEHGPPRHHGRLRRAHDRRDRHARDRKSTRLNSSHANISYADFCLEKKIVISVLANQRMSNHDKRRS